MHVSRHSLSLLPRFCLLLAALFCSREAADGDREDNVVVVTGPGGTAWTPDEGESWQSVPDLTGFWAVAFADEHTGWLVGTEGRIVKITF